MLRITKRRGKYSIKGFLEGIKLWQCWSNIAAAVVKVRFHLTIPTDQSHERESERALEWKACLEVVTRVAPKVGKGKFRQLRPGWELPCLHEEDLYTPIDPEQQSCSQVYVSYRTSNHLITNAQRHGFSSARLWKMVSQMAWWRKPLIGGTIKSPGMCLRLSFVEKMEIEDVESRTAPPAVTSTRARRVGGWESWFAPHSVF